MPIPQRQKPITDTITAAIAPMPNVSAAMRCWTRWNQFAVWEVVCIGTTKHKDSRSENASYTRSFKFPTRNVGEWGTPAFHKPDPPLLYSAKDVAYACAETDYAEE
jgi:hypothetical protein